jgi:hypothetical protein
MKSPFCLCVHLFPPIPERIRVTGSLPPISSSWRQFPWESRPVILFTNWILAVIVLMLHYLWREDGSVVYNCCWPSPSESFSVPSPAGLMTTFHFLRFETSPTWRARSPYLNPPGTGWPSYTPRHWVPFSPSHTTLRATVDVFDLASTRESWKLCYLYNFGADRRENTVSSSSTRRFLCCPWRIRGKYTINSSPNL